MGDKIDAADKAEVEAKLDELKDGPHRAATPRPSSPPPRSCTQAFYKVSEKLYQQTGAQASGPRHAAAQPGGSDGGTDGGQQYYDADYEVVDDDKK